MTDGEKPAIPKAIAEAICVIMGAVGKLQKTDRNTHAGYNFASIDAFLSAMAPLCADAGLFIIQDENDCEIIAGPQTRDNKPSTWLRLRFDFTLAHKSGVTYGPIRRSVMVQATGAQAFGSAQSYAEKQFMRSLFQIATGEKDDPDFQPHGDIPPNTAKERAAKGEAPKNESSVDIATQWARKVYARATAAKTVDAIQEIMDDEMMPTVDQAAREKLIAHCNARITAIMEAE